MSIQQPRYASTRARTRASRQSTTPTVAEIRHQRRHPATSMSSEPNGCAQTASAKSKNRYGPPSRRKKTLRGNRSDWSIASGTAPPVSTRPAFSSAGSEARTLSRSSAVRRRGSPARSIANCSAWEAASSAASTG